jgi:hypothetical protein
VISILTLTTGNSVYLIRLRAHGGCDRSAEDAYSSVEPDPTFAFVGGPCFPTLEFVIVFWIMITFYTLLTSLFCISKTKHTVSYMLKKTPRTPTLIIVILWKIPCVLQYSLLWFYKRYTHPSMSFIMIIGEKGNSCMYINVFLFVLSRTSNFSAISFFSYYRWRGCKFRPMLSAYGF